MSVFIGEFNPEIDNYDDELDDNIKIWYTSTKSTIHLVNIENLRRNSFFIVTGWMWIDWHIRGNFKIIFCILVLKKSKVSSEQKFVRIRKVVPRN